MNIKKRLILSNTATVIIPIIFTILTALIFSFILSFFFTRDVSYDNFKKFLVVKAELLDASNSILKQRPEAIEEIGFQEFLASKLSSLNGEIVVTKNGNVMFTTKHLSKIDIEKCLVEEKALSLKKIIKINSIDYAVKVLPLQFKDGAIGNAILLAPVTVDETILEKLILYIIIVFIISFIAVNIFMSYLFSKRILKPVSLLKTAASEISNGNLDCEIIVDGDTEIKELCQNFEHMRIQLKDSIRMKMKYDDNRKMLVSSISHDLKTPITSIKGYVEGILDGVASTPEKVESYLKTIYSKAEQIDVIIDDLLLYSKLDLNQLPFNYEKTNIVDYFDYCINESAPELERCNIEIDLINNLNGSGYVMIDKERMMRVITNIIDNSRKYMNKEYGEIHINLRETNSSIIVEIRDNGAGIDKDHINKVFDRFYRGDSARSDAKGSGLGLAIAKQIIEGHSGKIWATSSINKGTSIIISLAKA